ncbi:hypothetical protein JCGZ_18439 [Jatropha curcas]|uniref:Receptor-like serine/threonine-protein kinase n=1 Tax=Jatropha curcas TaxID=180498 RepID=A0A067KDD8_JATCU|nr:G-type lectin S-receptor-like serine/threonine-protein kinase SD2-5 [Jatropha curcas]KDP29864.1 hypothetical protein JCGZ_18439 [Jatropha curcas]
MDMKWVGLLVFIIKFPCFVQAETDYAFANHSNTWINNDFITRGSVDFVDGSTIRPVLLNNSNPFDFPAIGCGFYGNRTTDSFYFSVFAVQATSDSTIVKVIPPQVLWIANRANPVKENSTIEFTDEGELVLKDANGAFVWSSSTSNAGVDQMNVSGNGSLQLVSMLGFDYSSTWHGDIIWESWDLPSDTWLPGQKLRLSRQQTLTSSISTSNFTPGSFYLSLQTDNLYAFIESDPPQMYRKIFQQGSEIKQFKTGSLRFLTRGTYVDYVSNIENFQFLRLEPNGHLTVYLWIQGSVSIADDILTDNLGNCSYPTVCGNYGICSNGGSCTCPANYFITLNSSLICEEATQLSCQSSHMHSLIELDRVSYFNFVTDYPNTDIQSCKTSCLKNCACKAALFQYHFTTSSGNCSFLLQVFSLMTTSPGLLPYNYTTFVKVQKPLVASRPASPQFYESVPEPPSNQSRNLATILAPVLVVATIVLFLICLCLRFIRQGRSSGEWREDNADDEEWENSLLQVNLKRFTYQDLKSATDDFSQKLGGGGFGSVFEGTLTNGTKIAVKRLDRSGQGKKEFLAEVKTIGSIHHVCLVKLVGFCAENSHKLLVYEYMSNGSLDKWIFNRNQDNTLEWKIRKKIILNIAKGLTYLHEDCKMRIAHLDIKPQNILLDGNFDAKLSDFGLARLIDRNQNQVITQIRGTRGYMAPEWLSRKITEKVDVYSFGIVILEIICGRKNLDFYQPEEDDHLLLWTVKRKAEENQLMDLVDKCSEDMQQNIEEAAEMIRIAICCLHNDPTRRPSMSTVVKILEGVIPIEPVYDYGFLTSTAVEAPDGVVMVLSDPQPASILSGPR